MLSLYDCLSEEECKNSLECLYSLKPHWEARMGKGFPFYTLGTASYLDAAEHGQIYYKMKAQKSNSILRENFPQLYARVIEVLQNATGKEAVYEEEFALPGFHIFEHCELFKLPIASAHFDLQYQELFWRHPRIDYKHPLSFTLSLALPGCGGGLNYWEIFHDEVKDLSSEELESIREKTEKHYLPYQVGKMVIHEGFLLHQIAPAEDMQPEDVRITLQGHGLVCDNILRIYW